MRGKSETCKSVSLFLVAPEHFLLFWIACYLLCFTRWANFYRDASLLDFVSSEDETPSKLASTVFSGIFIDKTCSDYIRGTCKKFIA